MFSTHLATFVFACAGPICLAHANVAACDTYDALERDRTAILGMAGTFKIHFHFEETFATSSGYELEEQYDEDALEYVHVLEDRGDFISLQHLLVVGKDDRQRVVKHWRQDWTYEDNDLIEYRGHRMWERVKLDKDDVQGRWSQAVFQTDDAPRYEAVGSWTHIGDHSSWESNESWRPLPRRDYMYRDDYHTIVARNRHTVTPSGWLHEQDNRKVVLDDLGEPIEVLVHEIGRNTYTRINEPETEAKAQDYWNKHKDFWQEVRTVWAETLDDDGLFQIHAKVNGERLSKALQGLMEDAEQAPPGGEPMTNSIRKEMEPYLDRPVASND